MQTEQIYEQLTTVFHDVLDEDVTLTPTLTADDVDEWDSLSHVRLMLTVEKTFKVRFSASEIGGLKNVGDLVALIERKLG